MNSIVDVIFARVATVTTLSLLEGGGKCSCSDRKLPLADEVLCCVNYDVRCKGDNRRENIQWHRRQLYVFLCVGVQDPLDTILRMQEE